MPGITVAQESFAAGEVSPLVQGRFSQRGYQEGCLELLNVLPDSRGPARARNGTYFLGDFDANNARVLTFQETTSSFYIFLLTNNLLTLGSSSGNVPSTIYSTNPEFKDGSTGWTAETDGHSSSTVVFGSGECLLECRSQGGRFARVAQEVTVPAPGTYRLIANTLGLAAYRLRAGTASDDGTYYDNTTEAVSVDVLITVPGTTFWISASVEAATQNGTVSVQALGVIPEADTPPTFATPWSESELDVIQYAEVPAGDTLYLFHPDHPVQKIVYDKDTDSFTFQAVTFTDPPAAWGPDYPGTGTYFQGRLWLGGVKSEPTTLWGSESGSPEIFTPPSGDPLPADGAITIVMAKFGLIEWLNSTKNLLVGTEFGEHIVRSDGGILTPEDHFVQQQSAYGSADLQALQVGDQVFYISADRRKLRAMQYEWAKDNWLSTDLTYWSEHLTQPSGVKRIAWMQNPNNLFWCLLQDGTAAIMTYDRSNDVYGWAPISTADTILDISVGTVNGTSAMVLLVQRADGKVYMEVSAPVFQVFMDSFKEYYGSDVTNPLTGLDHLEGRTVQVLIDGAVHPDKVVSGGQIELEYTGNEVIVGLGYDKRMKPLPLEKGAPTGASMPWTKNFFQVTAHLLDSANPKINGVRRPSRSASTPMDTPEAVITGRSTVALTDWGVETDITIEQDLPLPMTVVAISGEIAQEKL